MSLLRILQLLCQPISPSDFFFQAQLKLYTIAIIQLYIYSYTIAIIQLFIAILQLYNLLARLAFQWPAVGTRSSQHRVLPGNDPMSRFTKNGFKDNLSEFEFPIVSSKIQVFLRNGQQKQLLQVQLYRFRPWNLENISKGVGNTNCLEILKL